MVCGSSSSASQPGPVSATKKAEAKKREEAVRAAEKANAERLAEEEAVIRAAEHYLVQLKQKTVPWVEVLRADRGAGGKRVFAVSRTRKTLAKKWSRRREQATERGRGRHREDEINPTHIGRIQELVGGKRGSGEAPSPDCSPDGKRQRPVSVSQGWTVEESAALCWAVGKHGKKWTCILEDTDLKPHFHASRTARDLGNRWRAGAFQHKKKALTFS